MLTLKKDQVLRTFLLNILVNYILSFGLKSPSFFAYWVHETLLDITCMLNKLFTTNHAYHIEPSSTCCVVSIIFSLVWSSQAIVCTILDERKRAMILDSSKVYLKGTSFFVTDDRTPQEQERRRQAYASRKANQNAYQATTYGTISSSQLKVMFWNCRGYPWNKGL